MNKTYWLIIFSLFIFSSCATDIDNFEQVDLTWTELSPKVKIGMIKAIEPNYEFAKSDFINLDSNITEATYDWINTGAGTGYHRFTINGKKFDDDSPSHGNKRVSPWVLYDRKLYFSRTFNVYDKDNLKDAEFCYVYLGKIY